MTDRPILYSGPMVRAMLDDRKTMTRRVLSRLHHFGPITEFGVSDTAGYAWHFRDSGKRWHDISDQRLRQVLPYAPGDRLWVRETWGDKDADPPSVPKGRKPTEGDRINYAADPGEIAQWGAGLPSQSNFIWRPSIHMPRWASRLTLIVTDVRVERLQGISEEDALAEGITCETVIIDTHCAGGVHTEEMADRYFYPGCRDDGFESAGEAFADLWCSINGPGAWDANPWVVATTFTVHRCNIDAMPAREAA